MQKEDDYHYPREPPPLPQYDISPELKKLVLMFMGAMLINFLIAGSLAIGMRIIQTDVPVIKVDGISQNVTILCVADSPWPSNVFRSNIGQYDVVWFLCPK